MIYKLVIDLDVEVETGQDHAIAKYLTEWYSEGSSHQTDEGLDYTIEAVNVVLEGPVE